MKYEEKNMDKDNNLMKYYAAIIILAAIVLLMLFLSGSGGKAVVETGDTIMVKYTGRFSDGTVFDTSDPTVAISNEIYQPDRSYEPLIFTVGTGKVISGFDEGVLGMKNGSKKKLTIPPEKAYGPYDPSKIQEYPLTSEIPATQSFPRTIEIPRFQFNQTFGADHKVGDNVQLPESNIKMKVDDIGTTVNLTYDLKVGSTFSSSQIPWEEKVISVNSTHITVRHDVRLGEVMEFPGTPWNSTVIEISNNNITLEHNPIPDTTVETMFGSIQIHFNETGIILDSNSPMAGKTLIFDIEIVSIEKAESDD